MSNKLMNEYESFLKSNTAVPEQTEKNTLSRLQTLMNPSALMVFSKILGFHFLMGSLSLSICHQFEMNPFGTEFSLDDWFMSMWGHQACMVFCGVLFVSLSVLAAGYFLTHEEVKALKRTALLQTLALAVFSLSAFGAMGAELALGLAVLWLAGALLGGLFTTQAVWKLKQIQI